MLRTLSSAARAAPLAANTVISNETKTRTIIPLLGVGSTSRRVIQRAASRLVNRRGPTRGPRLARQSAAATLALLDAQRGPATRCALPRRVALLAAVARFELRVAGADARAGRVDLGGAAIFVVQLARHGRSSVESPCKRGRAVVTPRRGRPRGGGAARPRPACWSGSSASRRHSSRAGR